MGRNPGARIQESEGENDGSWAGRPGSTTPPSPQSFAASALPAASRPTRFPPRGEETGRGPDGRTAPDGRGLIARHPSSGLVGRPSVEIRAGLGDPRTAGQGRQGSAHICNSTKRSQFFRDYALDKGMA